MKTVAACFVVLLAVCCAAGSAARARKSPPRLTYVNAGAICLAGAETSQDVRLTSRRRNTQPTWSPDGRRLAFVGEAGLYLSVQGPRGNVRRIAGAPTYEVVSHPAWSPNGRWIAFEARDAAGQWVIHVIRPNGTGDHSVTTGVSGGDREPAWSPDGKTIAFEKVDYRSLDGALYLTDAVHGERLLVDNGYEPSWSPDGTSIVFMRFTDAGQNVLFVVRADGSGLRRLMDGFSIDSDTQPAWSPGGQWIVFSRVSGFPGRFFEDIAVVRPDGTDLHLVRRVVNNTPHALAEPTWRPAAAPRRGKGRCS